MLVGGGMLFAKEVPVVVGAMKRRTLEIPCVTGNFVKPLEENGGFGVLALHRGG